MSAPTLTDGVVTLRPPGGPADVQGSWEQSQDPESVRWTTVPVPYSHVDAVEFLAHLASAWDTGTGWGFVVEHAGRYAGSVSLRPERPGRAEIGYGAHPSVRGVKIDGVSVMERAVRLLLDWGFAERGLGTVVWSAHVGNWASRKLAERVGFQVAPGVLRAYLPQRGELRDAWIGTLRRDDPREGAGAWLRTPVLRGERVVLRAPVDADLPAVVAGCRDERTRHWLGRLPEDYHLADAEAWLLKAREGLAAGSTLTWTITDRERDCHLGTIDLFDLQPGLSGEVGYWAQPAARGRGTVTEAARLVLTYAFETLGLQVVRGVAALENTASRHVLEAVGMRQVGTDPLGTVLRTGPADAALYAVRREEWDAR